MQIQSDSSSTDAAVAVCAVHLGGANDCSVGYPLTAEMAAGLNRIGSGK